MSKLTVAAIQLTSTDDVAQNLARSAALVAEAAASGAGLVGLPENFAYLGNHLGSPLGGGNDGDHRLSMAEVIDDARPGPILAAMQEAARRAGVWLLLGGFPEKGPEAPADTARRIRNSAVLLDPDGKVIAHYRKLHLFDVDVPGGLQFRESERIEPGAEVVVAETPWGGLGLTICYDLRFPELYRAIAARGARFCAVPSAFTLETGKDHWHVLLRARAIENQLHVFAPAQVGHHGGRRQSYGHALIVDPWGVVLAECGNHEGFAIATLDFDYQDQVRQSLPCLSHRRL
jgi:predicted amidohydrolase